MKHRVNAWAVSVLWGLTAMALASAAPVSAEVVLCESTARGSIKARQGSCLGGEIEMSVAGNTQILGAEKRASTTPMNPTNLNAAIECDPHEDRYWVKDAPMN